VAPLVIIRLTPLRFRPLTNLIFDLGTTMPDFWAALIRENGMSTVAN
jgi:hypothetical protein